MPSKLRSPRAGAEAALPEPAAGPLPLWATRVSRGLAFSALDRARDKHLRTTYGLSLLQYEQILAMQHGCCAICQQFLPGKKRMYLDHDHATGRVRGILCFTDNKRLLGRGLDKPELHEAAARYLRSAFDGRRI